MNEPLFMGIDGGGSTLRIAVVKADLRPLCSITGKSANPNLIGHDAAQTAIRQGIAEALKQARLQPQNIAACAIGIAGASNLHSENWLVQTVKPALPGSLFLPSSDLEIALVGSLAQRHGILLLAGTGSAVYGIAQSGKGLQIGGWGYLLGDEGSGYWIGLQLLRRITAQFDEGAPSQKDPLARVCLETLGLTEARELIAWLYRAEEAPAARIASLAELVLMAADGSYLAEMRGKWAMDITELAAEHLVRQVELMRSRLQCPQAPIAFAGGLLDNDNALSQRVARSLRLTERPIAKYSPVIGAALFAKMEWSAAKAK